MLRERDCLLCDYVEDCVANIDKTTTWETSLQKSKSQAVRVNESPMMTQHTYNLF